MQFHVASPSPGNPTIVHEIADMYEIAEHPKTFDNDHVALISESGLKKMKHRSDNK
jgi:hypothetical protein